MARNVWRHWNRRLIQKAQDFKSSSTAWCQNKVIKHLMIPEILFWHWKITIKMNQQHTQHIWLLWRQTNNIPNTFGSTDFSISFFFFHSCTNVQRRRYATTLAAIGFFHRSKDSGDVFHGDVDPCHGGPAGWMNWWRLVTQQNRSICNPNKAKVHLVWRNDLEVSDMCSKDHV